MQIWGAIIDKKGNVLGVNYVYISHIHQLKYSNLGSYNQQERKYVETYGGSLGRPTDLLILKNLLILLLYTL
jgi:hypothetical protein